jgi:hypothetical protein
MILEHNNHFDQISALSWFLFVAFAPVQEHMPIPHFVRNAETGKMVVMSTEV